MGHGMAGRLFQLGRAEPQFRVAAQDVPHAQQGADTLCQHGGDGCAAHAKAQRAHKGRVQPDIQHGAEKQKQQRRDAVAHGAQQRGLHIVEHRQRDAQQNYGQVGGGTVPRFGGDLQQSQQRAAAQQGSGGQHQRGAHRKRDHPAHGAAHALFIPGTEIPADRQCQAVVHAEGKVHDKTVQCGGRADLRQCRRAQQVPGKGGVSQIVELLQKVRAEQRHRKLQHQAEWVALGHIQHAAFVCGGHGGVHLLYGTCRGRCLAPPLRKNHYSFTIFFTQTPFFTSTKPMVHLMMSMPFTNR